MSLSPELEPSLRRSLPLPLLDGVTVLELGSEVAVRYCGQLFQRFGAAVTRARAPEPDLGLFGAWLGEGKRLLDGDVAEASVVLSMGGPDNAAHRADGPLRLDLSWFGDAGPYAAWRGADPLIHALNGTAYSFGLPEGPPTLAQGHAPQMVAGVTAFIAGVAALIGRKRGLPLRRAEVNVLEAALCWGETNAVGYSVWGSQATRRGVNRFTPTYPCSMYRTLDGWVGVTALTPAQWRALCGMVGRPEAADDPRFAATLGRLEHGDEVDALLAPALATRTTAEWLRDGDAARVPFAPVPEPQALPEMAHWRWRGAFAPVSLESAVQGPSLPFHLLPAGEPEPLPPLPIGPAGPLAGIRVVDFSMGWAGPLATRHLGDLGADVIKVESEDHPDWWRGWEARVDADPPPHELPLNFMAVNRSKRGVALDLRSAEGLAAARALIARADVVVENFASGVMDKLGLGPEALQAIRPGLVCFSMGAFGAQGPLRGLRAYGSTVEQASSLPFVNGREDWPPCLQHVAFGDPVAGLYAAAAALAALHGRERHGGAVIDLSQVECLFQLGAAAIIDSQVRDARPPRTGSRRAGAAPCACVPGVGDDAWLAVAVEDDAGWRGLCRVLGREDWAADAALSTPEGRGAQADALEAGLADWARALTPVQAAERLQAAGVPAAPVEPTHRLTEDPHLEASGFWQAMERRYVGRHLHGAPPYRFDGERPALRRLPPTLGEHTTEILAEVEAAV